MKKFIFLFLGVTALGGAPGLTRPASAAILTELGTKPTTAKLFRTAWRAGASDAIGDYEIAIGPNGDQANNTGTLQHDWLNGTSLSWSLTYNPVGAVTTLTLGSSSILYQAADANTSLDFDRFTLFATAQPGPFMADGTSIGLTISTINGQPTSGATASISASLPSSSPFFIERHFRSDNQWITAMTGTITVSWTTTDPQPNSQNGARARLAVRLTGYEAPESTPVFPDNTLPNPTPPARVPESDPIFGLFAVGVFGAVTRRKW